MKNFFIYLVSSLFLIFVVESKTGFDVLHNSEFHTTPQNSLKKTSNSDKIFQNGLSKKLDNIGNISLDFDDDFQISENLQNIIFISLGISLIYGLSLLFPKRQKLRIYNDHILAFSVKKYILIRSIRI
jgi:hypothetical protein